MTVTAITVTAPAVVFGQVDQYGSEWTVAEEDGWLAGPSMRGRDTDRPNAHGDFTAQAFAASATRTLTGLVKATDPLGLLNSLQLLASSGSDGGSSVISWTDPLGTWWATGRRVSQRAEAITDILARYQITYQFADSRKYGGGQSASTGLRDPGSGGLVYPLVYPLDYGVQPSGGRVTLINSGTAPAYPTITVTGPLLSGFVVTHIESARSLSYNAATSDVTLDCGTGTATEGGQDRTQYMILREWFAVPGRVPPGPGVSATFAFATLGAETFASVPAPRMTVSMPSAYW